VAILAAVKRWLDRFAFAGRKTPAPRQEPDITACPACGREMLQIEKFTMTGDDMWTYRCENCGQEKIVNFGPALWKVLHDANMAADEDKR